MTELETQITFAKLLPRLIDKAFELGFEVTLGESWRPPITAQYYKSIGKGISNSLHLTRMAQDLNLFRDKEWLTTTDDYRPLGVFWESLSTDLYKCRWGGRFVKVDGNHFSIEFLGRA